MQTLFTREPRPVEIRQRIRESPSTSELVERKMKELHNAQQEVEQLKQQLSERDREVSTLLPLPFSPSLSPRGFNSLAADVSPNGRLAKVQAGNRSNEGAVD